MAERIYNVLFLCTGNSARSIIAEAILNRAGQRPFQGAFGRQPAAKARVHPHTLDLLRESPLRRRGVALESPGPSSRSRLRPSSISSSPSATTPPAETCPVWPGQPMTAHWGVPDPAAAEGSEAEIALAFTDAYRMLQPAHRLS